MKLYGKEMTYRELQAYIGNLSQVAGIKPYCYADGRAKGVRAFEVRTGGGLQYNVIADRCLDVCDFEYKGIPFAFVSKAGVGGAWCYEPEGEGWAHSFNGGLFTTCGFTNAGMACDKDGVHYGMHGRASAIPAYEVCARTETDGEKVEFVLSGKVSEALNEQECITLHRTIRSEMGSRRIDVIDVYTNERFTPEPLLLIYHCNLGFPLMGPDAKFVGDIRSTKTFAARFPDTANALDEIYEIKAPAAKAQTHVFFHELGGSGRTDVGVYNDRLKLGLKISFDQDVLPYFTKSNIFKSNDYYMVLEPSNCYPLGRVEQEKQYGLEVLEPGERKKVELSFEVIE